MLRQAEADNEERSQDDNPNESLFPPGHFLVGEGVGHNQRGILRHGSEGGTEGGVDLDVGVDGPAVGVEHGTQVALAELEPCQQHGRTADDDDDEADEQKDIVPFACHKAAEVDEETADIA